jgi:RNA polymerase sigma factor, sigma-70 family
MTREQFITHVENTQKAFRRFLVALCGGDTSLADDVAQEAYIKAYLSSEGLNNPKKFNAWIYRIGYNTFINHKRSERFSVGYDEALHVTSCSQSDDTFRYQQLYIALNNLPDKERTSILLFYLEDYSIKEIAEIVGASQDAVKQHLSRGRNHLRGLLETANK